METWPSVTWDYPSLERTAKAVMALNPRVVYDDLEACISSIRNLSETSLYRCNPAHGLNFSTGGYMVTFVKNSGAENSWSAWPSVSAFTALQGA